MFYHRQKHYHTHGFFFILSLIVAFFLGRKSEQYGYTIISHGCGCFNSAEDDEMDMMNDPTPNNNYPR
ncbi:MAG TPA: hypothetical protein VN456_14075 [Desulfosporosinus sp.]|nr:hypothetical protein [Desulfosporosinus sp.]